MNKTELLNKIASTAEERQQLSHVLDQIQLSERRSMPTQTTFLTPAEQIAVQRLANDCGIGVRFVGGWDEAERRRAVFLPDWMDAEGVEQSDYCAAVRLTWYAPHTLTHRDLLGSLMGLGLRRDALGDLLVGEGSCDVLLLPELAEFVRGNLEQAGREKLHTEQIPLNNLHFPEQKVKLVHGTVASLRLDAVAAEGFGLSRSKLAELVRTGKVTVNWQPVSRVDCAIEEGAVIACRGLGKCRLTQIGALSRKGRINVTLERLL